MYPACPSDHLSVHGSDNATKAQTTNLSLMLNPSSSPTSTPPAPVTPTHSDLSPCSSPFHNVTANSYPATRPLKPPTTTVVLIPSPSLSTYFVSITLTPPSPTPLSLTQTTTSPALPSPAPLHLASTSPTPTFLTSTPSTLPGLPTLPPLTARLHAPLPCPRPKHHVLTCTRYLLPFSTFTSVPFPRTPKLHTGTPTSWTSDVPRSQTTTPYRSTGSPSGRGVQEM